MYFKLLIQGQNLLMMFDGVESLAGFYTTRFVEAADEEEAREKAFFIIQNDPLLQPALRNPIDSPPIYLVENSVVIESIPAGIKNEGYTFYEAEAEN